jgi:hypothetical protein
MIDNPTKNMSSHVPTAKKHKHKNHFTFTPTATPNIHRTETPTVHVRTRTEFEDEPVRTLPPLNATFVMDDFNHTDPPMPVQTTLLYSSSESVYTNPGVYVGAMFMLPMVVLGAWFVQGRARWRHYNPIRDMDDNDFP